MTASLRPFAHSRCLRVMGVLAWLMLVTTSLAAAPREMGGHSAHVTHVTVAAVGHTCHHGATAKSSPSSCLDDGCCGDLAGHSCHCATMCSSVLPAAPAVIASPTTVALVYGQPSSVSTPSPDTGPPMRPPLA
ncbi:hypothetical protein PY254_03580 [Rhodanobacter sp. AS-Z3]|uniref:hypothetical protein n=1 Tax=Rhodanobacter sp. AS-Z3 TaxID=3031330 RepID=UPI002479054F|nr:hypothetical protein [Rhodanobacter sp. AS-Z3]WEN15766.1 hypothetical protein PY254_03580 [Rhodanobacter sp. AS-Z3]